MGKKAMKKAMKKGSQQDARPTWASVDRQQGESGVRTDREVAVWRKGKGN